MNTLQSIRNWQHRSVSRTCAVFVAVWVNLVFQACAMAAMPADHCPHCPPEMHGSEMPMAPMECGLIDSIDDPNFVNPSSKLDSEISDLDFTTFGSWFEVPWVFSNDVELPRYKPLQSDHGPPLNVLFCVYLK